jgi:Ca-activated chloride channel family protein
MTQWLVPLTAAMLLLSTCVPMLAVAAAPPPPTKPVAKELGGHVTAQIKGKTVILPLLKTDIKADVQGDVATVTVQQTFENPSSVALNATYLFPLNEAAAVYAMTMEVGDEVVEAQIKKRGEAEKVFNQAQEEGKAAALLTQHRPNMFTQRIANLMPGKPVKVTLKYVQPVKKVDGHYELVVPLVVGPRYNPQTMKPGELPPAYPEVAGLTAPASVETDRVSINVALTAALPVQQLSSPTHPVDIRGTMSHDGSPDAYQVSLKADRVVDNKDFVLRYDLSGKQTAAGLLGHQEQRGRYFSLMIEPPSQALSADITPREMVFILDTSGSMDGQPLEASKKFMKQALKTMRPNDYFRIISFSNSANEFSTEPLLANAQNLKAGQAYVDQLYADGGTEFMAGLEQALKVAPKTGTLRMVVFLTDGYVGNESEILAYLKSQMKDARLYSLGVGTGVNRFLLEEMARMGRGHVRFLDPTQEDMNPAVQELAQRLNTPVMTDIWIDWGRMKVASVAPQQIPDLFAGDSVRVMGRILNPGQHQIVVHGKVNGRPIHLPLTLREPMQQLTGADAGQAVSLMWARLQVEEWMRVYRAPFPLDGNVETEKVSREQIEKNVTQLGLDYRLVTDWTSFVAVSKKVVNKDPKSAQNANVPLPMVDGITESAYPDDAFGGSSVPEPEEITMWTLSGLMLGIAWLWRRRQWALKPLFIGITRGE